MLKVHDILVDFQRLPPTEMSAEMVRVNSSQSYLFTARKIQTHKRLKRMLFIMTKHNMQIFGVSRFFQDTKQHLNKG